jgi:gliding motility-associated-like protein
MQFVRFNLKIGFLFIGSFLFSESINAQKPGWQPPNAAFFSFNTTVTAVIKYDGELTASLEDTIAFFVGDQIRGISIPTKIGNDIRHYATVYSSLTSESIKIKVYHAFSNKVYEVNDSLPFIAQSPLGNYEKPYEVILFSSGDAPITIDTIDEKFTLQNIPFDTIDLKFYLNQPDADLVTWSVSPHPDYVLNIAGALLQITPRLGFIGSGIIEIKGTEQTINANYATQTLKLNVLKVPVQPGWDSIPGQGITKGSSFKSFSLPDFENQYQGECLVFDYLPVLPDLTQPEPIPQWVVEQVYLNSMTFITRPVYTTKVPFNHPDDYLAAFIDGEIRGVAKPEVINGKILYFLGVGNQKSDGVVSLQFYSGALRRTFISPLKIPYITSAVRGNAEIPFEINLSPLQPVIENNNLVQLQIIDSAWVGKINFQFQAKDCSFPKLSAASRPLLESVTYAPFWVTSNSTDLFTYYKDNDGDGFGNSDFSQTIANANLPINYSRNKLDCDDNDDAINPYPSVAAVQDKSYCFSMLTDTIVFSRGSNGINSTSSKTIFKWSNNNTSIGLGVSGNGNITPFLTINKKNKNDTAQIIVTSEINGCLGTKDTFLLIVRAEALSTYYKDEDGDGFGNPSITITICDLNAPANYVSNKLDCDDSDKSIKPYPTLNAVQDKIFCFGMLTDSIVFTRSVNGMMVNSSKISYKWTNNNPAIGLVASGSGNIAPFLTINNKNKNDTAQIIVTPEINGCLGIKDTFLLMVKADSLPRVGSLNCSSYTISSLVLPNANDPYQNTLRLPYAVGNGISYDSMIIKSEGVLGLTMKLKPGTLSKGDGFLVFEMSGVPLKEGVAKFSINFGRTECNLIPTCEINFNVGIEIPKLNSILCSQLLFIPNKIYAKVPYHGKMELPYLGGNEKLAPSLYFQSEGIRGLIAKFNTDTLRQNGGTLRFNLDGMPEQLGNLSMTVEIGSKSCELNFLIEELPVIIPKFFSPNGDGKNEIWEIPYFNILYPQGTVIILDRFGRKLLEYKGNFEGWDGNIGGFIASTGVYWYIVQLEKESIPLKGNFTLMR